MLRKLVLGGALAVTVLASPALALDRPVDAIVAEIEQLKPPQLDQARRNDQAYIQEYRKQAMAAMEKRSELAKELFAADPNHPMVMGLMQSRWQNMARSGKLAEAKAEIEAAAAKLPEKKADLAYTSAQLDVMAADDPAKASAAAEAFAAAYPTDARAGDLLVMSAMNLEDDKAMEVYRRVVKDFPNARSISQAKGKLRQADGVGKPFELSFTEAITGKPISMADLRGKVVVVDFWATWCGPCVAEMPHMKEIYAKYKGKGVEFIGISLDQPEAQGGLAKLKEFVAKNEIGWPQYYQGQGWQSEFSSSWGINSIPALFVVDQKGNLHSVNARGKVEALIEKLLNPTDKVGG